MCGGDLEITEGATVATCEYCGTTQTVPSVDSEKKLTLFARANRLRLANEFDKASGIYESIVAEFPEEAEAYWGLVLCRYGIEYVDDPATGKKIPTCHRSSFDSVMEDGDFEQACENADVLARRVYREEAKAIEELRKGILEVSGKEDPYDIFICYKETAEDGQRTLDSVIAQDVYDALTEKGYRVFFSRISLEDKLGTEYEPYIFAALNSAKVMLAFGTAYEYFNAVWVKNEWSRFLALIASGQKKTLIPCYKGIDAYDMPKEFARLQAQDMGKVGAIQDLLRGIGKIVPKETAQPQRVVQQVISNGGPNAAALLKRGQMALEDQQWEQAEDFFDQVLNMDAECGEAYLGLSMVDTKSKSRNELIAYFTSHDSSEAKNLQRAKQYAGTEMAKLFDEIDKERAAWLEAERAKKEEEEKAAKEAEEERFRKLRELKAQKEAEKEKEEQDKRRKRDLMLAAPGLIAVGRTHVVGVRQDRTAIAVGYDCKDGECEVTQWENIVSVAAGAWHTVGLRADGTVIAVGSNKKGQCNVSAWTNIVAIAAGTEHTIGLRSDGTVVATGSDFLDACKVDKWTNIVAICAGTHSSTGLQKDKHIVTTSTIRIYYDFVAVAEGDNHIIGLRKNGQVQAFGNNKHGQCDVDVWSDIVAIAANDYYSVGLKADGTVMLAGESPLIFQDCDVSKWKDIVAISANGLRIAGLKSDGTIVMTGQCADEFHVSDWKLFGSLETMERFFERVQENHSAAIEEGTKRRIAMLPQEKARLEHELAGLGIFSGKRKKEIEERLTAIEQEMNAYKEH